jgi:mRNA interferase MazF
VRRSGSALRRGEIWLAALDPTIGAEIQKTRPCVIISPPEMHDYLRTVTVAPMTTRSHPAPYRIPLRFRGKDGLILLDQMRTLDRQRLAHRLGVVSVNTLRLTLAALRDVRGIVCPVLQDQVASSVVGAIEPKLGLAEIARASRKPTENLDAYDLYLRAQAQTYKRTKEGHAEAVRLLHQALELDAAYAPAMAGIAKEALIN